MADKDLTGKDLAKNLSSSKKDAAAIAKSSKEIEGSLSRAAKAIAGAFGKGGFVAGNTGTPGGNNGGSMPNQADMQNSLVRPGVGLTDFSNFAAGMAKGFTNFLPDVSSTIQRAGNYYNATIMGGYRGSTKITRGEVDDRTYGVLASMGGVTSPGSSAMVANIFANQGMVASSETYMQNVRSVGNAARYLNMSNEKAAAAIGGLGMGASSANLMRNFGVYTTDPTTGKERTMSQIFEDLAGRFTKPGANATAEDVQNSIRKGALGAAISASGLSEDQQTMFKQYMINRAAGKTMDLSNQSGMNEILGAESGAGNRNPLNAFMDLATSEEGGQKKATVQYIAGIETATIALKGLDLVAGELARVMGGVTAGLQTVLGARTTQGLMGMSGASINLMSSGIEAMLSADPTGISRAASGAAAFAVGAGGQIITNELAATGAVAGVTGADGSTLTKKGSGENDKPGAFDPLSKGFTLGGNTKMEVGQPLEGKMSVSGYKFHEKEPDGKKHSGIDYSATSNTKVYAVADGEISEFHVGMRDSQVKNGKAVYAAGQGNGNYVCIDHGVGKNKLRIYSYYKHLSTVEAKFQKIGAPVKKGDFLGYAGSTGDSTGTHLHYQVNEGGTEVDPSKLSSLLGNSKGTSYKLDSTQMSQATALTSAIQSLYSGDYAGALGNLGSLLGISDLASKYGVSSSSSTPANKYANAGNTATSSGGVGGSVTNNVGGITVNIKDATPESAKKFAEYVQEYLNNQTLTSNLGSL